MLDNFMLPMSAAALLLATCAPMAETTLFERTDTDGDNVLSQSELSATFGAENSSRLCPPSARLGHLS
ncbi:hypothetical protein [Tateyamaria sp. syn59]|uniref:hypothetical protein n=1 Tax=Tateyamaria sp. syn59 TaxID=2576942 RepID=UPI0011BDD7A2|nr:hypothetical protein [Tateyamaria sp. syn59]